MSKPKVWTLPALLDRIWMLSRGKRTAVETAELRAVGPNAYTRAQSVKRVVTGWDEDYKPRTYELNKISAASAAGLYERIKTMRAKEAADRTAAKKIKADGDALQERYAELYRAVPLANRNSFRGQLGLPPEPLEPGKPCGCPPGYACRQCAPHSGGI